MSSIIPLLIQEGWRPGRRGGCRRVFSVNHRRLGRTIVATEVREHEERSHSARYLVLIFLVCVATCGVFFSLGFLVGYNERASHSVPSTEVVTSPPVIPPTVNPPPDSGQVTPQESAGGQALPNSAPDTEVIPPGGAELIPLLPRQSPRTLCLRTSNPRQRPSQPRILPPHPSLPRVRWERG